MSAGNILIIDDEHSILRLSQILLQRQGYDVTAVLSVKEARSAILNKAPFDLIILDLMMPDENGFDFLKWKLEQPDNVKKIPVIVNTAKNLNNEESKFLSETTITLIQKGTEFTEKLVTEVENAFRTLRNNNPQEDNGTAGCKDLQK